MPSPAALPSPFPRKRLPALRAAPPGAPPPARSRSAARGAGGAGARGRWPRAGRWLGRSEPALCPRQPGGSGPSPGSPALGALLEGWKEPRTPEGARESQPRAEPPPVGPRGARGSRMRAGRGGKARERRLGADAEGATGSSPRSFGAAWLSVRRGVTERHVLSTLSSEATNAEGDSISRLARHPGAACSGWRGDFPI